MFGTAGNTQYDFEFDPTTTEGAELTELLTDMNVSNLRYPGGTTTEQLFTDEVFTSQNWENPSYVNDEGQVKELTPLSQFFEFAGAIDAGVTLVLPTRTAFTQSMTEAMIAGNYGDRTQTTSTYWDNLAAYIDQAIIEANAQGVQIETFEVGNEFWGGGEMTATEYGLLAAQIVVWLDENYDSDISIVVQSTSSSNTYSRRADTTYYLEPKDGDYEVHEVFFDDDGDSINFPDGIPNGWYNSPIVVPGNGGGMDQTRDIAQAIADHTIPGTSISAATLVDGVVNHAYFTQGFEGNDGQRDFMLNDIVDAFRDSLGRDDIESYVTEWSPNKVNDIGLEYASSVVEALFELTSNGVTHANFWPLTFPDPATGDRTLIDTNGVTVSGDTVEISLDAMGLNRIEMTAITGGNDSITGRGGNDVIDARAGSDWLAGEGGDDTLYGMDGNDTLFGGDGNDILQGGRGNDIIYDDAGDDVVVGGNGNDRIYAGAGADSYYGGNGTQDRIYYTQSDDGLTIDLTNAANSTGIAQGDTFGGIERLYGSDRNDVIIGDDDVQRLYGRNGNDRIVDGSGANYLYGGNGADTFAFILDGEKDRVLDFNSGTDKLDLTAWGVTSITQLNITVSGGRTQIRLNSDTDERIQLDGVEGVDATDFIFASGPCGDGTVSGTSGSDTIDDSYTLDPDGDMTNGAIGQMDTFNSVERVYGSDGDDTLIGNATVTHLIGGGGNDTITDGSGANYLQGDGGDDTFVFILDGEKERVLDFEVGTDTLDVSAWGAADIGDLTITTSNGRTQIRLVSDTSERIQLDNSVGITADDFIFA